MRQKEKEKKIMIHPIGPTTPIRVETGRNNQTPHHKRRYPIIIPIALALSITPLVEGCIDTFNKELKQVEQQGSEAQVEFGPDGRNETVIIW